MDENKIEELICNALDSCLESCNQECQYNVDKIDKVNGKVTITFPLVIVEEDNYVGFAGY